MRLQLHAPNLSLTWSHTPDGLPVPASTTPASLTLELPDGELQHLLFSAAQAFLQPYALTLAALDARLISISPTAARVELRATVRKSLLKATATVTAHAAVDDRLVLHLTDLQARGEGVLAPLIDSLLNRKLAAFNHRPFPLAQSLPPTLRVTQLTLTPGPPTHTLTAQIQLLTP